MRLCEEIGLEKLGYPIVVDIQNVADYYNTVLVGTDQEVLSVAPPWPNFIMEWCGQGARKGVQFVHWPQHEGGWRGYGEVFVEVHGRPYSLARSEWDLRDNGWLYPTDIAIYPGDDCDEETVASLHGMAGEFTTAFTAVMFANCHNVTIHDHTPVLTRQQRRHGPPGITYKVLDIAPMTRVLHDEGDIEHNGLKKALHICRGHFAHYGPDAKLFGKYEGTFWHPMHVRGGAEHGVVAKDYRVEPNPQRHGA